MRFKILASKVSQVQSSLPLNLEMLPLTKRVEAGKRIDTCVCVQRERGVFFFFKASLKRESNRTFLLSSWEEKSLPSAKPCCKHLTDVVGTLLLKSASFFSCS